MTFPEPGCGPTYEIDEFWEDVPPFSAELYEEMRRLAQRAYELVTFLSGDLVC